MRNKKNIIAGVQRCYKLGRTHRRKLAKQLLMPWDIYRALEAKHCKLRRGRE